MHYLAALFFLTTIALLLVRLWEPRPSYHDPQLHDGPWELVGIVRGEAYWRRRQSAYPFPPMTRDRPHEHKAHECHIGKGLSHYDRCECGAERYGIYGQWGWSR